MIYSDLIFVFAFLPIYAIVSFCCRESWTKNLVSVIASLLFIVWGRQWYYALIIVPVFLIYICGLLTKRFGAPAELIGDIIASVTAAFWAISLGGDGSLSSALRSVGFILFALRSIHYLKYAREKHASEKDFMSLAVYLISLENMLIAPLCDYKSFCERLGNRHPVLSKVSAGLSAFIIGFAKTTILGLSFDAVRLAATEYRAFPWLNAITLVAVTFGEVYVVAAGVLEMSYGLNLISGFRTEFDTPAFLPRFRVSEHIGEMWHSLPDFAGECFAERTFAGQLISLAGISLLTGVFFGFGSGIGAFMGIIILATVLEKMSPKHGRVGDLIFSAVLLCIAYLALVGGSAGGISKLFAALDPSAYEYDITYILNLELLRRLPWLIVGAIIVSPLYRITAAFIRKKMNGDSRIYAALRITETIVCTVLLVIAAAAAL